MGNNTSSGPDPEITELLEGKLARAQDELSLRKQALSDLLRSWDTAVATKDVPQWHKEYVNSLVRPALDVQVAGVPRGADSKDVRQLFEKLRDTAAAYVDNLRRINGIALDLREHVHCTSKFQWNKDRTDVETVCIVCKACGGDLPA